MHFRHLKLEREVPLLKQINEKGTRYYITPQGNRYPSVTAVLSEYNRQTIVEWRKRIGEEKASKISTQASLRGTRIHKLCEDYLNNQIPQFKTPWDSELFQTMIPELKKIDNIYAQELKMYSDHLRVAGTVDCIAEYEGRLAAIDFKTSKRIKNKKDIENYFMQVTAYAIMFEEMFELPVPNTVVIIAIDEQSPQVFVEKRDHYVRSLLYYRDLYEKKSGLYI